MSLKSLMTREQARSSLNWTEDLTSAELFPQDTISSWKTSRSSSTTSSPQDSSDTSSSPPPSELWTTLKPRENTLVVRSSATSIEKALKSYSSLTKNYIQYLFIYIYEIKLMFINTKHRYSKKSLRKVSLY